MDHRQSLTVALELYNRAKGTTDELVAYLLMRAVAARVWGTP